MIESLYAKATSETSSEVLFHGTIYLFAILTFEIVVKNLCVTIQTKPLKFITTPPCIWAGSIY